jgi:hypothetical protein
MRPEVGGAVVLQVRDGGEDQPDAQRVVGLDVVGGHVLHRGEAHVCGFVGVWLDGWGWVDC